MRSKYGLTPNGIPRDVTAAARVLTRGHPPAVLLESRISDIQQFGQWVGLSYAQRQSQHDVRSDAA
jgi:hypothetical protein